MNNFLEAIGQLIGAALVGLIVIVLLAWPVQLLWNSCLSPAVTGVNEITFWQALGLNILFNILVKSNTSSNKSK